jgi:hypothetical protein
MLKLVLLVVAVGAVLAGCGGGADQSAGGPSAPTSSAPTTAPASSAPASSTTPEGSPSQSPVTAAAIAKALKAHVPGGTVKVWTAETDPNRLLGRPGGYESAATVVDRRSGCSKSATSCGATVEVFAGEAEARKRSEYIQGLLRDAPALGTEYHYRSGAVLLRVSGLLTPKVAKTYEAALPDAVSR